ncbi:MAG: DoxX family protein [Gammaproteobacteria bacterium]|nr:DoxX family protein [Gammaproteobacteria bacterium]
MTTTQTLLSLVLASTTSLAPLPLRLALGAVFIAHGAQKLFGAFGGYGLEGTGGWMDSIGLSPGYLLALLAGLVEFFGGIAVIIGLLTRPAALAAATLMVVAITSVHLQNGFFMSNNGYEFSLTLLTGFVSLLISGPGRFAVDNLIAARVGR